MRVYYNETDLYAAGKIKVAIDRGVLPNGDIDTRSIVEVNADDLWGYSQCHFFAGYGGWALALKYAKWPNDTPVWTGSCPCQPFSNARVSEGGFNDARHLWPVWYELVKKLSPGYILGEQVASADGLIWWDQVQTDLETASYAAAATDICAAGFEADHIRQRTYWVADAGRKRTSGLRKASGISLSRQRWPHSPVDMHAVLERPYNDGEYHPKPLLRSAHIARTERVGELQAYGNGLDFVTAVEFCTAVQDALSES